MSLHKILATGALIASIGLSGCHKQGIILEGIVKEEFGQVTGIEQSSGAVFRNKAGKIEKPKYGLVLESQGRTYFIQVENWHEKPVVALARAIEPGDRVKIVYEWRPTNMEGRYSLIEEDGIGTTYIGKDGIGTTPSTSVSIIEKGKR